MATQESAAFKASKQGISLVLNPTAEFSIVLTQIEEKLQKAGDFFSGAAVTIVTGRALAPEEVTALVDLVCQRFGLRVGAIVQTAPKAEPVGARLKAASAETMVGSNGGANDDVVPTARRAHRLGEDEPTLLVRRTVRSGQRVSFAGNVVVVGDVNPDAEVAASGDVIVLGTLRGTVHAGATGNQAATVMALRLMPTQLRIAQLITRAPDGKAPLPKGPEIARVKGEAVVVEAFTS